MTVKDLVLFYEVTFFAGLFRQQREEQGRGEAGRVRVRSPAQGTQALRGGEEAADGGRAPQAGADQTAHQVGFMVTCVMHY